MRGLSQNLQGAGLMALAMAGFASGDTIMKVVLRELPLGEVIFLRGVMTTALVAILAWGMGVFALRVPREAQGAVAVRALSEVAASYCFMTALQHMPIGSVTAILQVLPLSVTLAGALLFREPVGWRRGLAIAVGFLGVMLIIRPGGEVFTAYALYGLGAVAFCTTRDLATRRLPSEVHSLMVTAYTSVAVTVFGAVLALSQTWVAPGLGQLGLIALGACTLVVAYLCLVMGMRVGDVSFVAPFRYTGLLVAIVLGFVVFGDWPDALSWLGCLVLVGAGVFSFWREAQARAITPLGSSGGRS